MKKVIAKIDFTTNIGNYVAGEEIKNLSYEQIVKLNEMGFIEPLSYEDLVNIEREYQKEKSEL